MPAPTDIDQAALWAQWQGEQNEQAYDQLIFSLDPLIKYQLNKWATNPVNPVALKAKAYSLVRDSLSQYDPAKGALSTHVINSMMPLHRYVTTYQNPVSIPERLANEFGKVRSAEDSLKEILGRRPTVNEIARETKMSADKIERIRGGMSTSVPLSTVLSEADESAQTLDAMNSIADRNIHMLRAELSGQERKVFDFISREANRRRGKVSAQEVADAFDLPVEDVYAYRSAWSRRLRDVGIQ
jgi:DNA-directed RNA polymerase specialized sigma subunit